MLQFFKLVADDASWRVGDRHFAVEGLDAVLIDLVRRPGNDETRAAAASTANVEDLAIKGHHGRRASATAVIAAATTAAGEVRCRAHTSVAADAKLAVSTVGRARATDADGAVSALGCTSTCARGQRVAAGTEGAVASCWSAACAADPLGEVLVAAAATATAAGDDDLGSRACRHLDGYQMHLRRRWR